MKKAKPRWTFVRVPLFNVELYITQVYARMRARTGNPKFRESGRPRNRFVKSVTETPRYSKCCNGNAGDHRQRASISIQDEARANSRW